MWDAIAEGLNDYILGILRGIVGTIYRWATGFLTDTISVSLADQAFKELLGNGKIYAGLHDAHQIFVAMGNLMAVIFMVYGLYKVISKAGQTDGGIDTWQLVWVFVMYGFATMLINSSWEIMQALFTAVQELLISPFAASAVEEIGDANPANDDVDGILEGINEVPKLISLIIPLGLMGIIAFVSTLISHAVLIARAVQIYLYTLFAPIPLGCIVSETGQEMTRNFFKKYLALLLSAAILIALFFMNGLLMGDLQGFDILQVAVDGLEASEDLTDVGGNTLSMLGTFKDSQVAFMANCTIVPIVFGWACFKSGAWAREIIGC